MSERAFNEEDYAQLRRAIRVDLTDELSGWVRRRFWWMAGLCGLAGVVGISSLFVLAMQSWLEQTLAEEVQDLEKNVFAVQQKTVDTLVDNLIQARLITAQLDGRVEVLQDQIEQADQRLVSLQTATESTGMLARAVAQERVVAENLADTNPAEPAGNLLRETKGSGNQKR